MKFGKFEIGLVELVIVGTILMGVVLAIADTIKVAASCG